MIGVLFDLDGTLLDTLADLTDATNWALRSLGYPERTVAEVRSFVGNGAGKLMEKAVPKGADSAPALAAFQQYYAEHCQIKTGAYPGIMQALAEIRQKYPVAIVSNKPDGAVKTLAAKFFPGIPAFGEAGLPRKPAPDMVYHALKILGVEKESAAYVGDSEVDVATAKNAEMDLIAVSWGFRSRARLKESGAVNIADDIAQLREKVL